MLLFDDLGQAWAWDFMPDWIGPRPRCPETGVDKPRWRGRLPGPETVSPPPTTACEHEPGLQADPPYYAYQFNGVYYKPETCTTRRA